MGLALINCSMPNAKWSGSVTGYLSITVRNVLLFKGMCSPDCGRLFGRLVAMSVFNFGETKELSKSPRHVVWPSKYKNSQGKTIKLEPMFSASSFFEDATSVSRTTASS